MPDQKTVKRARRDKAEGKAPSTQAGEFVREEMAHIRERKHGAQSAKQAIAIGLSKARRAGVKLPAPKTGTKATKTGTKATKTALKKEGSAAASPKALSRHAKAAARHRGPAKRSAAAKKAARTRAAKK